jgi:hypothetical protein
MTPQVRRLYDAIDDLTGYMHDRVRDIDDEISREWMMLLGEISGRLQLIGMLCEEGSCTETVPEAQTDEWYKIKYPGAIKG